jgi:hypothetical protein
MVHPGKENVPLLMSLLRHRPAAGEGLVQQFKPGNARHGKLTPVRQTTAAAFTCDLIGKEMYGLFLNAIIVRLYDSDFIEIGEPQQTSLMNGRQDALMNARIDCGRGRMPYYTNWASHRSIICDFHAVDDTQSRLVLNL